VVTLDEVAAIALELPGTTEGSQRGNRSWTVAGKAFAWERPFSKADIRRFGDEQPPTGPIVAVRVEDLHEKEAVLAAHPGVLITIPHFDGFAAVLILLDEVTDEVLRESLVDGWLTLAPPDVAEGYLRRR
jgi:hypothetical protein